MLDGSDHRIVRFLARFRLQLGGPSCCIPPLAAQEWSITNRGVGSPGADLPGVGGRMYRVSFKRDAGCKLALQL